MRLIIFFALAILFSTLCGCSVNWHIKRAAYHTEKAIKKGYKPLHDTIKSQATIAIKYNTDYLSNLKPRILKQLDSIVLSDQDKEKVVQIVYREVESAKDNIDIDSTISIINKGDSIGFINATVKDGELLIKYAIKYPQPIVYTQSFFESIGLKLRWWHKFLFWFAVIVITLLLLYLKLKPV